MEERSNQCGVDFGGEWAWVQSQELADLLVVEVVEVVEVFEVGSTSWVLSNTKEE